MTETVGQQLINALDEIERLQMLVKELADELDSYSRGFRVASLRHYQPDLDVVQRAREPKP